MVVKEWLISLYHGKCKISTNKSFLAELSTTAGFMKQNTSEGCVMPTPIVQLSEKHA